MEHFNRGERRLQDQRLKKSRKRYWGLGNDDKPEKKIGILLHTPAVCSCFMCGNPRKHFNKQTIQELRAQQDIDYNVTI